jgi:bifunctional non-homologous end joining protein LigD
VAAVAGLPARSCVLDGEAIACDENGLSVFEMIRWRQHDPAVTLCVFDLVELDGEDLRREPIETRKATLKSLWRRRHPGIAFSQHFAVYGESVYRHVCALGCEGIVSKRLGSPYKPGRVDHWLKIKNPAAPAVKREARRIGREPAQLAVRVRCLRCHHTRLLSDQDLIEVGVSANAPIAAFVNVFDAPNAEVAASWPIELLKP